MHTPIYPCNNAEEIKVVAAWPGYGPAIYDLAMSISKNGIFADRRSGDACYVVADNSFLIKEFKIYPRMTIEDMCKDGWKWKSLNPNGF